MLPTLRSCRPLAGPSTRAQCWWSGISPRLGQVAAYLITSEPADWNIKKGAIWWLTYRMRGDQGQLVLRAVMSPELV